MAEKLNVYEMVTEQILAQLEKGTVPWRKPWRSGVAGVGPTNLVSNKPYRGINVFLLNLASYEGGYASPYWLTFKQAKDLGGSVRKGEHGTVVVFWQMVKPRQVDPEDPNKMVPMLRSYRVFNLDQTDGVKVPKGRRLIDEPEPEVEFDPIEAAEAIIAGYRNPPKIVENEPAAWYRATSDLVNLPPKGLFDDRDEFYATAFHELGHSTGHKSRLDRLEPTFFGSHEYGREELVAEMTAAFLSAEAGIESTRENSASYLAGWIRTIREDPKAVVMAAGKAQKAADWILGRTWEEEA